MNKEQLSFKAHAHIKNIIGRDLIYSDNVAILELVKNSFDALSPKVIVEFKNIKRNNDTELEKDKYDNNTSQIIIQDFGIGMDRNDIVNKWLNIAYSEKKDIKRKEGRQMAGSKGIGRFSCDRLGQFLDIYTRKKAGNYYHLKINWKDFEVLNQINTEIQQIKLEFEELNETEFIRNTKFSSFESGTILQLSKLHKNWSEKKKGKKWDTSLFISLRESLSKLINPNQAFDKGSFDIFLKAEEFKNDNKLINTAVYNPIFRELNFKTTSLEVILEGNTILSTLKHKGNEIFILEEKNNFESLKGINISLNLFYLNPYSKSYFTKSTGKRVIEYGSIYLFLNGFRIPPYGDPNDDWLGLEIRKGQGHSRYLSGREVVGHIEIKDEEGLLQIISSREGLAHNKHFNELTKKFFMEMFKRLEKFVVNGLNWDSTLKNARKIDAIINADPNWNEKKEEYRENEEVKQHRIFESLKSIINVSDKNVIDFTISEELIKEIAREQKEKVEKEYQKLLQKLNEEGTSKEALIRLFEEAIEEPDKISSQTKQLKKYNLSEKTQKDFASITDIDLFKKSMLAELSEYRKKANEAEKNNITLAKLKQDIEKRNKKLETDTKKLEKEKGELEKKRIKAEQDRKKALKQVEVERRRTEREANQKEKAEKETLFIKEAIGVDTKELISLQHHVTHTSKDIASLIDTLISFVKQKKSEEDILRVISKIDLKNKEISTLSQFVVKANFDTKTDKITTNIVSLVNEYLENVYKTNKLLKKDIQIKTISNNLSFELKVRPIQLIIIINNLINNADKAGASEIKFTWMSKTEKSIKLVVWDNGSGISDDIIDKVFDFKFTTTNGAGLGLFHTKGILDKLKSKVEVSNHLQTGSEFIITFNKK